MTPEGKIVAALRREVKLSGGIVRKVEWSGVRGAPDLLVMMNRRHVFVECKAPGAKPEAHQLREHKRMEEIGGCDVFVIDSLEAVDELVEWLL